MKNKNKYYYIFFFILFFDLYFLSISHANEKKNFLSLKNNKVNLRQGPSFDYPIKLIYNKKYLPIIIIGKSGTWRKISDFQNNTGWIHISQLSKKKSAINIKDNSVMYKKSTIFSKPLARLELGRLVLVKKCKKEWCKISSEIYNGWILKKFLWGRTN